MINGIAQETFAWKFFNLRAAKDKRRRFDKLVHDGRVLFIDSIYFFYARNQSNTVNVKFY